MLRTSCKGLLIVAACVVAGARLHNRADLSMLVATQEVNRCLKLLRAAAASKAFDDTERTRQRRPGVCDR